MTLRPRRWSTIQTPSQPSGAVAPCPAVVEVMPPLALCFLWTNYGGEPRSALQATVQGSVSKKRLANFF